MSDPGPDTVDQAEESLDTHEAARLKAVLHLARECRYEPGHAQQVTALALSLYDGLGSLHQLDDHARYILQYASLLHDIGWIEGRHDHHKTSLQIILQAPSLPFSNKERLMIGSVARYHRKALPSLEHDHFFALDEDERQVVSVLAAILRVADCLDQTHQSRIAGVDCLIKKRKIVLRCRANVPAAAEQRAAEENSDLWQIVFQRMLAFEWIPLAAD